MVRSRSKPWGVILACQREVQSDVYKSLIEDLSPGVEDSPSVIKKIKTYSLVDTKLRTPDSTSLEIEVVGPETLQTFDVGAAVRVEEKKCNRYL